MNVDRHHGVVPFPGSERDRTGGFGDNGGSSDGGGGGMLEARVAKIEAHIEHLREDVRDLKSENKITWGALFFIALGLAGMMAKGFGWL